MLVRLVGVDDGKSWPGGDRLLHRRADNDSGRMPNTAKTAVIVFSVFVGVFILALAVYLIARILRRRNASPKYIPSSKLKDRWRQWANNSHKNRGRYSDRLQPGDSSSLHPVSHNIQGNSRSASPALEQLRTMDSASANGSMAAVATIERDRDVEAGRAQATPAARQEDVDRRTSVRSIMTLPVYSADPGATERILGREGDRAGVDVVVEYPETMEEEEELREAEMQSLYQIRHARRTEAAEREERRRLRREARARGDWAEVERLRLEAREAQERRERELLGEDPVGRPSAARLIAEHQEEQARRERQRRVSSVQYAEIGVARHDGSRVRAGSTASARSDDNRPLLDSAATMGQEMGGSGRRGNSISTLGDSLSVHHRNRSSSSVLSFSSVGTDEQDTGAMYQPPFAPSSRGVSIDFGRGRSPAAATPVGSSPDFEVVSLQSDSGAAAIATPRASNSRSHSRTASMSGLARIQTDSSSQIAPQDHQTQPSASTSSLHTSTDERPRATERSHSSQSNHPHLLETPVDAPPHYEHLADAAFDQPPNYESPVSPLGAPQLPSIERLPSIRVSESVTPVDRAAGIVAPRSS